MFSEFFNRHSYFTMKYEIVFLFMYKLNQVQHGNTDFSAQNCTCLNRHNKRLLCFHPRLYSGQKISDINKL